MDYEQLLINLGSRPGRAEMEECMQNIAILAKRPASEFDCNDATDVSKWGMDTIQTNLEEPTARLKWILRREKSAGVRKNAKNRH